jgi:hypothetical protein
MNAPVKEEDGLNEEQEIEGALKGKLITRPNILSQEMTTLTLWHRSFTFKF